MHWAMFTRVRDNADTELTDRIKTDEIFEKLSRPSIYRIAICRIVVEEVNRVDGD